MPKVSELGTQFVSGQIVNAQIKENFEFKTVCSFTFIVLQSIVSTEQLIVSQWTISVAINCSIAVYKPLSWSTTP